MWPKMAIMTRPSVAMIVQSSGMLKASPACADSLARRAIIHSPVTSTSSTAASTAERKRCRVEYIRRTRSGGSSCIAAGRRKKWAKTMPPIHTTMARMWSSLRMA
ncbi:hypothetical protein D9M69_637990 [compost metagenome]